MTEIILSPFKRKLIEDWVKEVTRFYNEGSICRYVLNSITADEHDRETAVRPTEGRPNADRKHNKLVHESGNFQTLPAMPLSYLQGGDKRVAPRDTPKQNPLSISTARVDQRLCFSRQRNQEHAKLEDVEEGSPMIIVDPHMMAPTGDYYCFPKKTCTVSDNKSPHLPSRHRESSFNFRRQPNDNGYLSCNISSAYKNSFVVSKTNIRGSMNWKNHSFLGLPIRFRQETPRNENKPPQPANVKEPSDLVNKTEGVVAPTVWAW